MAKKKTEKKEKEVKVKKSLVGKTFVYKKIKYVVIFHDGYILAENKKGRKIRINQQWFDIIIQLTK